MPEHPLKIFEKTDPELRKLVQTGNDFALADGALPRKVKLLIAMALDAAHCAGDGVKSLADLALKAGATKEEIMEAVRVATYVCGVGAVSHGRPRIQRVVRGIGARTGLFPFLRHVRARRPRFRPTAFTGAEK